MKTWIIALVSAVVGSTVSLTMVGQAQASKTPSAVAWVSATRIIAESTHGRTEAQRVQTAQQQRANDLRSKQQLLETTRQQLATTADAAARAELQQRELQHRTDLERSTQQAQIEFQTLQRDFNADLQRRVRAALDELMKTQSYQLVLNSDVSLMWAAPELDMTSAVIARMNAQ
jgi:Skp family chaperone for outer membrane proteins